MANDTETKTKTQEDYLNSKIEEILSAKMALIDANEFKLGVTITDLRTSQGKQKTSKDGSPLFDTVTGEALFWSDSHYATITFNGGEIKQKITDENYVKVVDYVGQKMLAVGRLKQITPETGNSYIVPEFMDFQKIF